MPWVRTHTNKYEREPRVARETQTAEAAPQAKVGACAPGIDRDHGAQGAAAEEVRVVAIARVDRELERGASKGRVDVDLQHHVSEIVALGGGRAARRAHERDLDARGRVFIARAGVAVRTARARRRTTDLAVSADRAVAQADGGRHALQHVVAEEADCVFTIEARGHGEHATDRYRARREAERVDDEAAARRVFAADGDGGALEREVGGQAPAHAERCGHRRVPGARVEDELKRERSVAPLRLRVDEHLT